MHQRVVDYETGLPTGYHKDSGELLDFEQVRADPSCVLASADLTQDQRLELAKRRIEQADGWLEREFHPGGLVDQERARYEVERGGDIHDLLVETEVRVAAWVVAQLISEAADA